MNGKQEFLTEEKYEKGKGVIKKVALVVLVLALLVGGILICLGITKVNNAKKTNEERYAEAERLVQQEKEADQLRISEIDKEIESLNTSCDDFDFDCTFANKTKVYKLEFEKSKLENKRYTVKYDEVFGEEYYILVVIGAIIVLLGLGFAIKAFLFSKRREIMAFTTQQVMPVAQEGIEKMAPTFGNAAGEIAKGISKGVQEGKNEANKNE